MSDEEVTPEQRKALDIARALVEAGIPVFAAAPCPDGCKTPGHAKNDWHLPRAWQKITPSLRQLDRWRPGWALAAIGGWRLDVLDHDPRAGGDESLAEIRGAGHMPRVFGRVLTSGGGQHFYITPLRERECNKFMPGLDYQGGDADGEGRAFAWIPPTVRRSKDPARLGELVPYTWAEEIDFEEVAEYEDGDDSGEMLRARILAKSPRAEKPLPAPTAVAPEVSGEGDGGSSLFGPGPATVREERSFTEEEAKEFLRPALDALREAPVGEIEERANRAAVALSHFVPTFWSAEVAYAILRDNLGHTAYDENGPYASWSAEKFKPVLNGTRPPRDPWRAVQVAESVESAPVTGDAVEALLAEMLTPGQIKVRERPRYLIKGLLNMDSESWIIGEPGSKKSFVALDMLGHVAAGKMWQGRKVNGGAVVIIVAEGAGGIGDRITAYESLHGVMPENVHILPRPVQAKNIGAWAVLVEACRRIAPVLVVIDTQARVTVGLEENSATELGIYIEAVRAAREATGACVLTVHHTGRKGGDARGSSAIDGAQSTELKVTSEGLAGTLSTEKQKDLPQAAPIPLRFKSVVTGVDEDGDPITSLAVISDAFELASGEGRPEEVEPWEAHHGAAQVHLLKVLRDQGGSVGLTKSEARASVVERFYRGDSKALARSTWSTAWTKVLEKRAPGGDAVAVSLGGQRWGLDLLAFGELNQAEDSARSRDKKVEG